MVIKAPITTLTKESLKDLGVDNKTAERSKNMFALGMLYFIFNRDLKPAFKYFEQKFRKKGPEAGRDQQGRPASRDTITPIPSRPSNL